MNEGYRNLALSAVLSGVKCKDIPFLRGDWCRELCDWLDLPFDGKGIMRQLGRLWRMSWKDTERELARRLNGHRVGNTGSATPDVVTDWLAVEVKTRKALPDWLWQGMAQAVRNNDGDGRLPVLLLHQTGARHDDDFVVMRLYDFREWFGDAMTPTEAE